MAFYAVDEDKGRELNFNDNYWRLRGQTKALRRKHRLLTSFK